MLTIIYRVTLLNLYYRLNWLGEPLSSFASISIY